MLANKTGQGANFEKRKGLGASFILSGAPDTPTNTMTDQRTTVMESALKNADELETTSNALDDLQAKALVIRSTIAGREADIYGKVCDEMTGDKPRYTNDGARKAEASVRAGQDAVLTKLRAEATKQDVQIAQHRNTVTHLRDYINIRRAFLHGS